MPWHFINTNSILRKFKPIRTGVIYNLKQDCNCIKYMLFNLMVKLFNYLNRKQSLNSLYKIGKCVSEILPQLNLIKYKTVVS